MNKQNGQFLGGQADRQRVCVGIMQPYFVPYIGYWQLVNAVDKYVIYDDVNYINRGWVNRNRILINYEVKYFNVPLIGASQNKKINEIFINTDPKQINKCLHTIWHAYKKAPFFDNIYPIIERIFDFSDDNLAVFLFESFKIINSYLGIETEMIFSSELNKDNSLHAQDKILSICELLGATDYYNAIGGQALYSYSDFKEKGMELKFLKTDDISYKQFDMEFQSNLSIIDVMMFNNQETVKQFLSQYTLI